MTFNFGPAPAASSAVRPAVEVVPIDRGPDESRLRRKALLVGQPNVGKSVIFGALTGTYVTVSNYPGTTVEITRASARFGDDAWEMIDTPGTHNLVPMSEDESVTRDLLLTGTYDALVQVGDAKNLSRTLLLALQIAELGVPFCLDLNMLDEARARGLSIDLEALQRELVGVRVTASTATEDEGLDAVREYLAVHPRARPDLRAPLACAPRFPSDIEAAIATVEAALHGSLPVAKRAVATMLLGGERGVGAPLVTLAGVSSEAARIAAEQGKTLARVHGVPVFALLSRLRLARVQTIVRGVQRRDVGADAKVHSGPVGWESSGVVAGVGALFGALAYDGAVARVSDAPSARVDSLASYGFFDVVARLFSPRLFSGWTVGGLVVLPIAMVLGLALLRRHARVRAGAWKLFASFAAGWLAYWLASSVQGLATGAQSTLPIHLGAVVGLAALAVAARAGEGHDAALSRAIGHASTDPVLGWPILAVVLLLAYKVVGVFGAGTAVDFVEKRVFGELRAHASLATPSPAADVDDFAADGTERLLVSRDGPAGVAVVAQVRVDGAYRPDPDARIDVYGRSVDVQRTDRGVVVQGDAAGAEARVWSGALNRWAYRFFAWLGLPLLTAFFVGTYGLVTMGMTYAVAIVLPVVTTFFFVFSMLEDSGYLPRLAVMSNRVLRGMGLNGKAVLPMVLGLGCDTMATLTARIMETRKERMLVTLLLALGIPCSSQLSVIFALMQRTSATATAVWVGIMMGTLLGVGWVAARVLPGDKSDFLLEMPPIRQPMIRNIVTKTMARIEWYLKEAVPLFLAGTALLFVLDATHMLGWVHRAGAPIVQHVLGFSAQGGLSDRVSEALLVGFLRRDFGAAGLLDLARAGRLTAADVAVSMVTITLFIPCIANVFMIAKERGWKVAGAMSAFIFPYAVAVGAVVRLGYRVFGGGGL
jgi:Fe2+ transport system protein B